MTAENTQPHIVIVGGGFGGLRAARALAKAPVRVTLIDRNNFHLFQPLLYQVATAGLAPEEIAYPLRGIIRRQKNLEFRMTEVQRVDADHKTLHTDSGEISYDYLIMAAGGTTNYFGMQSVEEHSFGLKEIHEATAIRNHILRQFELAGQESDLQRRRALLTFVVVGGGPTGVECAGAISELIRLVLTRDYPRLNLKDVQVILIEAADRLLANLTADLSAETAAVLTRKHVDVRFGCTVAGYDGHVLQLKDGTPLPTHTVIWAAGVRAAPVMDTLGAAQASLRRVRVTPTLHLPERPEVFVIGDAAYLEGPDGKAYPMVAPAAMQQADFAVRNILHQLHGETEENFQYKDLGSMATIGRNHAVAMVNGIKFRGIFAWFVWLLVHLMQLVGFRNRLAVLFDWTWSYFSYDRSVRLIWPEEGDCPCE